MESSKLTEEQRKLFCEMMYKAFEEIRSLAWVGFPEQAGALADAFHNVPHLLFESDFSWERARMYVESYQRKFPTRIENNIVYGSYYDYMSMLDEIEKLDRLRSDSASN